MSLSVEERLYRVEQALERALNVNLAQFDPDPAVSVPALTPTPAPVPDPAVVAAAVAEKTAHDDAAAAAAAAIAAAPTVEDKPSHLAQAQADVDEALKNWPDSPALQDAKAQLENLAAAEEAGEDDDVPPAQNPPASASA